jgi:PKD repeat protein
MSPDSDPQPPAENSSAAPMPPTPPVDAGSGSGGGGRSIWGVVAIVAVLLVGLWLIRGCNSSSSEVAPPGTPTTLAPTAEATLAAPTEAAGVAGTTAATSPAETTATAPTATAQAGRLRVVINAPATGTVGAPIAFAAVTVGADNPIMSYRWDFGDGGRADGASVSHVFDLAGSFLVVLTAVDSVGQFATAQHRITLQAAPPPQQPPSAAISGPTSARTGVPLTFDGSASTAGSAAISTFAWNFGDGGTANGASVTHTFTQAGTYHVVLTVTDANGQADNATQTVQIALPDPPRAVIVAPSTARIGQIIDFDGSTSTSGSPIDRYNWTFGDGGAAVGARVTYAYGQAGTYTVVLTVVDRSGAQNTANHRIVVQPDPAQPPTATLTGPSEAQVGTAVTFSAAGSSPGSSPVVRHDWSINGAPVTGQQGSSLSETFSSPGAYSVTVIVTDANGLSDSATHAITILPDFSSMVWLLDGSVPPITLTAGEGTGSGSAGCNTYQVTYTATGGPTSGQLSITGVTTTFRVCDEAVMTSEKAYLETLGAVTEYAVAGNQLTLTGPGGTLVYSLQP